MASSWPGYFICFFFLFFFIFVANPFPARAQTHTNISLGSFLTATKANSSWVSPSGEFAFGFQQIVEDGFLLAIWFNRLPEQTVVWSVNGDSLVQSGSTLELTTDGSLILKDKSGKQIWSVNSLGTGVSYAAMLDTGNFVLASQASAILWQSFDYPTDTILPTQTMSQNHQLVARYLETNYSQGRFRFILQGDGNLVMYPTTSEGVAYWSTQTSIGSGYQLVYNQSGYIYLIAKNGTILNQVFSNEKPAQDYHQRATLDFDGVLRQYNHPKSAASGTTKWPMAWTLVGSLPPTICTRFNGGGPGSGACGFNSYCSFGEDQRPSCHCPPGYTFLDPNDVRRGCKQNFIPQSCDESTPETESFTFADIPNCDFTTGEYEIFHSVSEDWCRQNCLDDCYCNVAIFSEGGCYKKKSPFSFGKMDPSFSGKALIKVRKNNSTSTAISGTKMKDRSTLIVTGSVLLGSSVILNVLLLLAVFLYISPSHKQKEEKIQAIRCTFDSVPRSFTYKELETATEEFREELGRGAFGTVHKGVEHETNQLLAVKRLNKLVEEGEQEFKTEVQVIGRTNHKNLVQLLGFCNEGQHRLLVYEYMCNGSLASLLFGESKPNWYRRTQIAFGIARGLLYLHEECYSQIIHCDIKPQNILLDESLTARISDFGLAKLMKKDQTRTTTAIRGTKGYVAPEWFKSMPVTAKVDVYSFGILLLELICLRRNFEVNVKEENQIVLADYAYDCYRDGKLHMLVENNEEATGDMKMVRRLVMVAIWCIQEDPSLRPAMKKVVQMLEGAVQVPIPPDPASFISAI